MSIAKLHTEPLRGTHMQTRNPSQETQSQALSGAGLLTLEILLLAGSIALLIHGAQERDPFQIVSAVAGLLVWTLLLPGFFVVEPNLGRVLVLFGSYRGTVRKAGF